MLLFGEERDNLNCELTGFVQTCEKIYQNIEQINKTIKSYIAAITKCSDFL